MSYIATSRSGDQVFVWERNQDGQRVLETYPTPYYFYAESSKGEYTSMYGEKLSRFDFNNNKDFQRARQELISNGVKLYESDIPPELKILSEHYYNVPAPKLNVTFLDIEVDYSKEIGFSTIDNALKTIGGFRMGPFELMDFIGNDVN